MKITEREAPFERYKNRCIYMALMGSRAYGTHKETSDYDYRGVYLAPTTDFHGFTTPQEQIEHAVEPTDVCVWELGKFVKLALKANPNILEVLWMSEPSHINNTYFQPFITYRKKFLSKEIATTYMGYAKSQFYKMGQDERQRGEIRWKHAGHLIRLMKSGIHAMNFGEIMVRIPEGSLLERIKLIMAGGISFQDVMKEYRQLEDEFREAESTTQLPDKPDIELMEGMLKEIRATTYDESLLEMEKHWHHNTVLEDTLARHKEEA